MYIILSEIHLIFLWSINRLMYFIDCSIDLNFISQLSCKLVSSIVLSTSKCINPIRKLKYPPQHIHILSFLFFTLHFLCLPLFPILKPTTKFNSIIFLMKKKLYECTMELVTFNASSTQFEETSTMSSLILVMIWKSKCMFWLLNFGVYSSSLILSSVSISLLI